MKKKIKSIWIDRSLESWLVDHAKNYFDIKSNFNVLCNKVLEDYAKEHGYNPEEEESTSN